MGWRCGAEAREEAPSPRRWRGGDASHFCCSAGSGSPQVTSGWTLPYLRKEDEVTARPRIIFGPAHAFPWSGFQGLRGASIATSIKRALPPNDADRDGPQLTSPSSSSPSFVKSSQVTCEPVLALRCIRPPISASRTVTNTVAQGMNIFHLAEGSLAMPRMRDKFSRAFLAFSSSHHKRSSRAHDLTVCDKSRLVLPQALGM